MDAPPLATPKDRLYQSSLTRKVRSTVGLVALLAAPVLLIVVLQRSENPRMLRVGDSIPAAALVGLEPGDELLASISGRRAAILFFSVDCPHCQREIPLFNEACKQFASQVQFVSVALNDREKSQVFTRANIVGGRVLVDEKGVVGQLFGISELPALFLVDQDQKVDWVGVGEQPRTEILRRLSTLVDRNPLRAAHANDNTRN